jgi:magnesium-transporting ATPase (P-type)
MRMENKKIDIDLTQFIPRGTIVRNSGKIYMIVVYTGRDTKIIMNNGKYKFKKSSNDKVINIFLAWNVFVMLVPLGITLSLLNYNFRNTHSDHSYMGLEPGSLVTIAQAYG